MVFSTNQVIQFYNLTPFTAGGSTVTPAASVEAVGKHKRIVVANSPDGQLGHSPLYDVVLGTSLREAKDDVVYRKALKVELATGHTPVVGGKYILTLTFRNTVGEEDTVEKFAEYYAKDNTSASFYKGLAESLLQNQGVGEGKLYQLYSDNSGPDAVITDASNVSSAFYIVEAEPDWELGSFPLTLEKVSASTNTIVDAQGLEYDEWLASLEFTPYTKAALKIVNSKKVADLEYFAIGERGISSWQNGWPMNIRRSQTIDGSDANGYSLLIAHVARIGDNQNSTYQEMDLIFALAGDDDNDVLSTLKTAIEA